MSYTLHYRSWGAPPAGSTRLVLGARDRVVLEDEPDEGKLKSLALQALQDGLKDCPGGYLVEASIRDSADSRKTIWVSRINLACTVEDVLNLASETKDYFVPYGTAWQYGKRASQVL